MYFFAILEDFHLFYNICHVCLFFQCRKEVIVGSTFAEVRLCICYYRAKSKYALNKHCDLSYPSLRFHCPMKAICAQLDKSRANKKFKIGISLTDSHSIARRIVDPKYKKAIWFSIYTGISHRWDTQTNWFCWAE